MTIIYFSKDARLPVQLQRAMAKEAEAARDARAKVSRENLLFSNLFLFSKQLIFLPRIDIVGLTLSPLESGEYDKQH